MRENLGCVLRLPDDEDDPGLGGGGEKRRENVGELVASIQVLNSCIQGALPNDVLAGRVICIIREKFLKIRPLKLIFQDSRGIKLYVGRPIRIYR